MPELLVLADGLTVEVVTPDVPNIVMGTPVVTDVIVLPVTGGKGDQGVPGLSDKTLGYHHTQLTASDTWTINHGLGFNPAGVWCRDSTNSLVEFEGIAWPTLNTMIITFHPGRAFSGSADVS